MISRPGLFSAQVLTLTVLLAGCAGGNNLEFMKKVSEDVSVVPDVAHDPQIISSPTADSIPVASPTPGNDPEEPQVPVPPEATPYPIVTKLDWSANQIQIGTTPLVADLNQDGRPEIIAMGYRQPSSQYSTYTGALLIFDGPSLDLIGAIYCKETACPFAGYVHPAVANIDNDPQLEIVIGTWLAAAPPANVVPAVAAFEFIFGGNDVKTEWVSRPFRVTGDATSGKITVADLNQDGAPEIIAGDTVLSNRGEILLEGMAQNFDGAIVTDLDLDGKLEALVGGNVIRCNPTCQKVPFGPASARLAAANFVGDAKPEIVSVTDRLELLDSQGQVLFSRVVPGENTGAILGAPVVADFDGDGKAEIGIGGISYFTMFDGDGTPKWHAPVHNEQRGSLQSGASAFDFDADGISEIVYNDSMNLRILRGNDGASLVTYGNSSGFWTEYPIVADVEGDGSADVVIPSRILGQPMVPAGQSQLHGGLRVIGHAGKLWKPSRKLWNQYHYHFTNVRDNGSIPVFTNPIEILAGNLFRSN